MELPQTFREELVVVLDEYLDALSNNAEAEAVAAYVIELLETWADDQGEDDLISNLEDDGALEGPLQDSLEMEMNSNDEFEYTGEEVVSLLEQMCDIEWEFDEEFDDDLDDFDEDDEDDEDDEGDDL